MQRGQSDATNVWVPKLPPLTIPQSFPSPNTRLR
jgi:hypothetical protein